MKALPLALGSFAIAASLACETPTVRFATESAQTTSSEGLRRLEDSGFQWAWARPGSSFAGYRAVWLRFADEIRYRRPPQHDRRELGGDNYPLSEGMAAAWKESLETSFRDEIVRLSSLQPTDAGGSGVLEVRAALIDLVLRAPIFHLSGDDLQWIDSLGEVTIAIELVDSETGEVLARLAERDRMAPESLRPARANPRDATFEINRLLRRWSSRLGTLLAAFESDDPLVL